MLSSHCPIQNSIHSLLKMCTLTLISHPTAIALVKLSRLASKLTRTQWLLIAVALIASIVGLYAVTVIESPLAFFQAKNESKEFDGQVNFLSHACCPIHFFRYTHLT